jgi:hypothetical protein
VGNARRGIYLFYPDSVRVAHNEVYDFEDFGISAKAELGGAVIDSNVVYRDQMTGLDTGKAGIVVTESRAATVRGNTVQCLFSEGTDSGVGIWAANGKAWCQASTGNPFELLVEGNHSYGPFDTSATTPWTGMRFDWACGVGSQDVTVTKNVVNYWFHPNATGVLFNQSSDVQFTQNVADMNFVSLDYTGTDQTSAAGIRLRKNHLETGGSADARAVRTDDAAYVKLGPDASTQGNNLLETDGDSTVTRVLLENLDTSPTVLLQAGDNQWRRSGVNADSTTLYDQLLDGNRDTIVFMPLSTDAGLTGMPEPDPPTCVEARVLPSNGSQPDSMAARLEGVTLVANDEPGVEYALSRARPSPTRGRMTLEFTIAPTRSDHVRVQVYDVSGRAVRGLVDGTLPRGRYRLDWDGRNESGRPVAGGIYFVRLHAGNFHQVQKVVVVR